MTLTRPPAVLRDVALVYDLDGAGYHPPRQQSSRRHLARRLLPIPGSFLPACSALLPEARAIPTGARDTRPVREHGAASSATEHSPGRLRSRFYFPKRGRKVLVSGQRRCLATVSRFGWLSDALSRDRLSRLPLDSQHALSCLWTLNTC